MLIIKIMLQWNCKENVFRNFVSINNYNQFWKQTNKQTNKTKQNKTKKAEYCYSIVTMVMFLNCYVSSVCTVGINNCVKFWKQYYVSIVTMVTIIHKVGLYHSTIAYSACWDTSGFPSPQTQNLTLTTNPIPKASWLFMDLPLRSRAFTGTKTFFR